MLLTFCLCILTSSWHTLAPAVEFKYFFPLFCGEEQRTQYNVASLPGWLVKEFSTTLCSWEPSSSSACILFFKYLNMKWPNAHWLCTASVWLISQTHIFILCHGSRFCLRHIAIATKSKGMEQGTSTWKISNHKDTQHTHTFFYMPAWQYLI